MSSESLHQVTLGELARLLGVRPPALYRLEVAGLLARVATSARGEGLYRDADFGRLRLYLDLIEAGVTMDELRGAARLHAEGPIASLAARKLVGLLDGVLTRLQARIDRLRGLRADLIASREALARCHGCHRPVAVLACRTCRAMPDPLPRTLDKLFCAAPDDEG